MPSSSSSSHPPRFKSLQMATLRSIAATRAVARNALLAQPRTALALPRALPLSTRFASSSSSEPAKRVGNVETPASSPVLIPPVQAHSVSEHSSPRSLSSLLPLPRTVSTSTIHPSPPGPFRFGTTFGRLSKRVTAGTHAVPSRTSAKRSPRLGVSRES